MEVSRHILHTELLLIDCHVCLVRLFHVDVDSSPMHVALSGSVLTYVSFTHPIKSGSPDRKHKQKEYVLACSTLAKRIWLVAQVADKWTCKSAQLMLLESENNSLSARGAMSKKV